MHRMTIGLMALLAVSAQAGEMGTITVLVTGIESERGTVLIQLANSAADYDRDDDAFRYAQAKATLGAFQP